MSDRQGVAFINRDTVFRGRLKGARLIEVDGYIEGNVSAERVVVNHGGQLFGRIVTGSLEVHGTVQGDILARGLVIIGETGAVSGDVQYGAIQMDPGGDLSASMKNIPPKLTGDFEIGVNRGSSSIVTPEDLQAVDPDNSADELTFRVLEARRGHLAFRSDPTNGIVTFSQADLDDGRILFQHDGSAGDSAHFKVSVTDASGATAAEPATVRVAVAGLSRRDAAAG